MTILKRLAVGRPISSHAEMHHRLTKRIALAVFSSDALSSSAYATDEIILVLMLAGAVGMTLSLPVGIAVGFVLAVVITSYRQTVRAYPSGGGAYIVTHENLGKNPGLIAASSILIDYVLTVAVSVAAGVAAIGAAVPFLRTHRVVVALGLVGLISLANLRGLKESGTIFAIPTYGFLISVGGMIIYGYIKVLTGNYEPLSPPDLHAVQSLSLFLVLRAFASGSTALTGVEAIADGVPAFKPPEAKNAAQTLLTLGILLAILFLGITFLANAFHVDPVAIEHGKTVTSQIATAVFGGGFFFYVIQFFTAFILFLAANTSYADFPRLASILARDRYLPKVFQNRGDRLAFSNGIIILAVATGGLLINYDADHHRIIPLYVVGVFTSFTLSQSGMLVRWFRIKSPGWRRSALVNGVGAFTTGVVLVIVAYTKFKSPQVGWLEFYKGPGAWQVIVLIPLVAWLLSRIGAHFRRISENLRIARKVTRIERNKVVVLVSPMLGATLKALSFARAFSPEELHVVSFRVPERRLQEIRARWQKLRISNQIEATGHHLDDLIEYLHGLGPSDSTPVTVVIPDPQYANAFQQIVRGRMLLRIKGALLSEPGVVVISVPFRPDVEPEPDRLRAPTRLAVIVVVSAVHRATIRALEYARSLQPAELKAITISVDPNESAAFLREWQEWEIDTPLEIIDSPYRSVIEPILREVRALGPNPNDAVGVVIPEFIVAKWWQHFLHGQTALTIKTALLFQPNVIVIDVPYPLASRGETEEREPERARV